MTPEQFFADLVAAQPSRPFVSYYDDASGERSELSARSMGNWVAKTHFLLIDELGLGVGDSALIALPAHWISVPAVLGCLSAGLALTSDPAAAAVAFVSPDTIAGAEAVADVYAVAPDSAAVGFRGAPPAGAEDYVTAVRPQPDKWATVHSPGGETDPGIEGRSRSEVAEAAVRRAAELGLKSGARVLSARDWSGPADWIDTLLAPLAVGGSVVYVRNSAEAGLARHYEQEHCTAVI